MAEGLRVEDGDADQLQPDRLRRRHRRDHGADGRLRRERRAADAGPDAAPARAASRSRGCCPRRRSSTTCPSVPNNLKLTGPVIANIYLGKITQWNDPAIKALNPRVNLPSTKITPVFRSDGSGTTYNFTDYLSAVSPAFKSKVGTRRPSTSRPASAAAVAPASPASSRTPRAGSATSTSRTRWRTGSSSRPCATPPASSSRPGCAAISGGGGDGQAVPASNEMHIVNPPKTRPAGVPDLHVLVRPAADEDGQGARAAQVRLLRAHDQGQKFGPKLLFVADPEGRAGRVREDAEAGPGLARLRYRPGDERASRRRAPARGGLRSGGERAAGRRRATPDGSATQRPRSGSRGAARGAIEKRTYWPSRIAGTSTPSTAGSAGQDLVRRSSEGTRHAAARRPGGP